MGNLDGRVAIVTGGARGIGREYSLGLAREGCAVVIADLNSGQDVVDEIVADGGTAESTIADVSSEQSTKDMAAFAADKLGRIDILVNNAALYTTIRHAPFDELTVEEWDQVFAVNVRGPWLCARAVAPYMRDQQYGKIINIASMTVPDGTPGFMHYVTSKAAIIGLTRTLARELGDDGIAVNTVTPDYIPHDEEYAGKQTHVDELIVARRAFKRTETPADMVGTVIYLSGPGSDFVTGQNLYVNGGGYFG